MNKGGAFNAQPWQDYLEKEVFKVLADLRTSHDTFHNRHVGVKNTKIYVEGYELISIVAKQAQNYVDDIYTKSKIDIPETLKNPKGIFEGHEVPGASRVEFENKRRVLTERLEKAAPPAPSPAPSAKPK